MARGSAGVGKKGGGGANASNQTAGRAIKTEESPSSVIDASANKDPKTPTPTVPAAVDPSKSNATASNTPAQGNSSSKAAPPGKGKPRPPARAGGRAKKSAPAPPPPPPPPPPRTGGKPKLDTFGRDLTAMAAKADPVVGREDEIDRVVCILSRKSKNSAVLVGAPGVGKTAIAEGLAQRIARGEVSGVLAGARVVEINVATMISGTSYRGDFEERFTGVIAEAEAAAAGKAVVLFVDEIHMLLGAGRTSGSCMDAANMLKPALARGRVRCLGATTHGEYQHYFLKDKALERRFQKVHVAESTADETISILRRLKVAYEEHHGMEILDEALIAAVKLSGRYIPARHFPDKAIDLVDEACATARLLMDRRKKQATSNGAKLLVPKDENIVGPDHIAQIVSKWTGIPVTSLGQDERKRLLELPERLHRRVIDQDEAVNTVAEAVVRSRSGLGEPNQPSGSFLFLGPTGVGKTELAKALAEQLFGNEKLLVRIDMSEYINSSSVTRLIGACPGSYGYDKGGQLTELVHQRPYSVVLLDEVEKANASVLNVFLQILDDGRVTDGQGRTVDFTNTIIIMTSNLGAEHLLLAGGAGDTEEAARQRVIADVQKHFRPELINRLTEIVMFHPLSGEQLRKVARMQLRGMAARLAEKGIGLDITDAALDVILSRSSDQVRMYGARPIKRCLQKNVMTRISKMMVQEEVDDDCYVSVDADQDKGDLVFAVDKQGSNSKEKDAASSSSLAKKRKRRPPARHLVVIDDENE